MPKKSKMLDNNTSLQAFEAPDDENEKICKEDVTGPMRQLFL